jgi:beta-lactam-binding protein with PASTA domain
MESGSASTSVLRRIAAMALLLAVFGLSALFVMYVSLRGRTVRVPNVVSLKESVAQDELESSGLTIQVRGRAPHPQIQAGAVTDQSPAAGTTVKTGQLVRVTLSLGLPPAEPGKN